MVNTLPSPVHRVLERTIGTWLLIVVVVAGAIGISFTSYVFVHTSSQRCTDQQAGWDNRRDAWLILTRPVEYPPGAGLALMRAQDAANALRAVQREVLLDGLGDRPDC